MSSHSSREYYYTSSEAPSFRSMSTRESLPPLRSVLGAQLDLPVQSGSGSGSYDLREMSKALPRSSMLSASSSDYRASARSSSGTYVDRDRESHPYYRDQRAYTYPPGTSNGATYSSTQKTGHSHPHHDGYNQHHVSSQSIGHHQDRSRTPTYDESEHRYGSSYSDLSRTDRAHGNKKYACTWPGCEKRFERQNALDTHMNIHTDQKPYACPVDHCGKVFNVRSNMRRHLLTHKDYQMDEEEYRPVSSSAMRI